MYDSLKIDQNLPHACFFFVFCLTFLVHNMWKCQMRPKPQNFQAAQTE